MTMFALDMTGNLINLGDKDVVIGEVDEHEMFGAFPYTVTAVNGRRSYVLWVGSLKECEAYMNWVGEHIRFMDALSPVITRPSHIGQSVRPEEGNGEH